jgi:acyl-CoA reductase-like NAD-dependent aldehyde dehydrogenase
MAARFDTSATIPVWLDGKEVVLGSTFDVTSPVDGKKLYSCSSFAEEDVEKAITSAQKAFPSWAATKPNVRRDIFLRAAEGFAKRRDELLRLSNTETGAAESMFDFEYGLACNFCKEAAGLITAVQGTVPTSVEDGK